jgi:hypothetical protein
VPGRFLQRCRCVLGTRLCWYTHMCLRTVMMCVLGIHHFGGGLALATTLISPVCVLSLPDCGLETASVVAHGAAP